MQTIINMTTNTVQVDSYWDAAFSCGPGLGVTGWNLVPGAHVSLAHNVSGVLAFEPEITTYVCDSGVVSVHPADKVQVFWGGVGLGLALVTILATLVVIRRGLSLKADID